MDSNCRIAVASSHDDNLVFRYVIVRAHLPPPEPPGDDRGVGPGAAHTTPDLVGAACRQVLPVLLVVLLRFSAVGIGRGGWRRREDDLHRLRLNCKI